MAQIALTLTEEEIQGLFRGDRGVAELLERVLNLLERVLNQVLEAEIADQSGGGPARAEGRQKGLAQQPLRAGAHHPGRDAPAPGAAGPGGDVSEGALSAL